jgi:hypothetical protein
MTCGKEGDKGSCAGVSVSVGRGHGGGVGEETMREGDYRAWMAIDDENSGIWTQWDLDSVSNRAEDIFVLGLGLLARS